MVNAYRMILKHRPLLLRNWTLSPMQITGEPSITSVQPALRMAELMNSEAMVVHDGTNAFIHSINEVFSASRLFTLAAAISGDDVVLTATPLVANTT